MHATCLTVRAARALWRGLWFRALFVSLLLAAGTAGRPALAGTMVAASCPCGYAAARLPLFGGFANYRSVCLFPAICQERRELVLINLLAPRERPKNCPHGPLLSLADPGMAPTGGPVAADWNIPGKGPVRLFADGYPCPRCGKRTLTFHQTGSWD